MQPPDVSVQTAMFFSAQKEITDEASIPTPHLPPKVGGIWVRIGHFPSHPTPPLAVPTAQRPVRDAGRGSGGIPSASSPSLPGGSGAGRATDPSAGESGAEPAGRLSPPSAHTSSIGADSHGLAAPTAPPTARHGSARDASGQPPKSGLRGEPRVRGAGSPIKPSGRETGGFGIQADTRGGVQAGLWVQVQAAPLIWGAGSPVGQDTGRSTSPGDPGIPTGTERGQWQHHLSGGMKCPGGLGDRQTQGSR